MNDQDKREKVIKGLEVCSPTGCAKEKCPYYEGPESEFWGNPDGYECEFNLRQDAIKLLKAQEPVKPVFDAGDGKTIGQFLCGKCHAKIGFGHPHFCWYCGKVVKWE